MLIRVRVIGLGLGLGLGMGLGLGLGLGLRSVTHGVRRMPSTSVVSSSWRTRGSLICSVRQISS